jgi:hypothetical protein
MKICIKETEFNPSLLQQSWCSEELAIEKGYTIVEVDEAYKDCCFEDFNEDLTFNVEKYNNRKQTEKADNYENEIISLIRQKYTINQELAILRQRDIKPEEYQEYFDYVEQCKAEVKAKMEVQHE